MKIGINKKIGIVLLVIAFPWLMCAQQAQTPLELTLDKAIEVALSSNPTVKIADMEVSKKKYAKKSAESALYPQIDAVGQYTRTLKKQVMYMDGAFDVAGMMSGVLDPIIKGTAQTFSNDVSGYQSGSLEKNIAANTPAPTTDSGGGNEGIEVGRDNNWSGGLNLSWPVVVPTLWKSLQISSLDVELAVEQAHSSKINMINSVRKAFYNVLLAQDSYNVFKESYDNAILNYNDIKNKYDQGLTSEFDLIRADVRVKNIKPNMVQSENALSLATLSLKALMGIDMDQPVAASGKLKDYEEKLYSDIIKIDTSLVNNSDLKQFDLQNKQLKKTVELYKAQYLPIVSISGNYMYMSMNNDFKFGDYKWNPYSTIGLTVSIPIFDGFKKRSDIRQTKVSLQQMDLQREDIVRNLKLGVNNSINNMISSVEQVISTKDAVNQAQKGYIISQKRYDTGMGTLLELNDAELSHSQASLAFNQAIYNYLSAKADLDKTLGIDVINE
ncbi:MAG: TolC family protein [Dysgonamonadaceae bacterium]|jgi:outer membrane protein TolC|nr:TolC family protein [Dysgonamonadaceae bacterium]